LLPWTRLLAVVASRVGRSGRTLRAEPRCAHPRRGLDRTPRPSSRRASMLELVSHRPVPFDWRRPRPAAASTHSTLSSSSTCTADVSQYGKAPRRRCGATEGRDGTRVALIVGGEDPEAPPTGSMSGTPGSCARRIPTSEIREDGELGSSGIREAGIRELRDMGGSYHKRVGGRG
jgi:hypothetical protein